MRAPWIACAFLVSAITAIAADQPTLPQFVDVTASAGIGFVHSIGDNELSNIVESSGAGCVFFDYDNDGDLDIYLVNGRYLETVSSARGRHLAGKLKNSLYRNNGDATFTDVTEKAGVGDAGFGMAAVAADYDNDGDRDLFVTNYGRDSLYLNNGDGTFTDVTAKAGVGSELWSLGASFFDFDRDGLLDLYVGGYLVFDPEYRNFYAAEAFPGPLSYQGQKDILYRNKGDGTFEDVTRAAGVYSTRGRAMGLSACDIDDDGDEDLYVANDGMENYLYRNRGNGTFEEIALRTGTAFGQNGEATSAMGPEFGDYDGDGLIDLLVPDMGYGCLYRNTGKGLFEEKSAEMGIAAVLGQYTSWSGNFLDYDHDGVLDVFIVNGDAHHLEPEEDTLFRGESGRPFVDVSAASGPAFKLKAVGRGSAAGDFDDDGDLDLLVLNLNGPARLYRNDGSNRGNWIMVRTVGTAGNRDGIGARIRVTSGGTTQVRDIRSSSGYLSQSDPRAHFGVGKSKKVDRIEVRWPSGRTSTLDNVKVNQVITVTEPEVKKK
jgi:hypothetical protein